MRFFVAVGGTHGRLLDLPDDLETNRLSQVFHRDITPVHRGSYVRIQGKEPYVLKTEPIDTIFCLKCSERMSSQTYSVRIVKILKRQKVTGRNHAKWWYILANYKKKI